MAKRGEQDFNHYEVFKRELGITNNYNRAVCPFHGGKSPSLNLFQAEDGTWLFKCFGCEAKGNLWTFLNKRHGYNRERATEYIKKGNFNPAPSHYNSVKRQLEVEFNDIPFSPVHHKYWNSYELSEEFVKSKHVYACDKYAINGKLKKVPIDRILFIYFAPDIEQCKFLFLGENVKKEEKWRSYNIQNTYLWGYSELEENSCNKLFVTKSYKDQLVLNYLGYCAISTQNEDSKIMLTSGNVEKINKISKEIYIGYGSDVQGKTESIKITKETGWRWLNTPNYTLKYGINDFAEYSKEFGINNLKKEIDKRLKKWTITNPS